MITDRDRELGDLIIAEYENACGSSNADNSVYVNVARIRAESAEQARKEAAERVAAMWREHGEDITLRIIHDAILSTVNESFTVAPVPTDSEKLAIAVKALEEIVCMDIGSWAQPVSFSKLWNTSKNICEIALKEIQG